jgi:hypothetical protein
MFATGCGKGRGLFLTENVLKKNLGAARVLEAKKKGTAAIFIVRNKVAMLSASTLLH